MPKNAPPFQKFSERVDFYVSFSYLCYISPMEKPKILAVVGPTASGKTALAIELAKRFNGEVISADSRQVYQGLDLGSGKVTTEEMNGVAHHLLDVADLSQIYTGADFARDANLAIADIHKRGKLPIIAGGTFFYIELLKGTMSSAPVLPNPNLRLELEKLTTIELWQKLQTLDTKRAETIDPHNRRRLIRSLEIIEALGQVPKREKTESDFDWLTIGIRIEKEDLRNRIKKRLIERLEKGMIKEVENLLKAGVPAERLIDLGLEYRYITEYLQNKITEEEMVEVLNTRISQFAKRQYTWLKRDTDIVWFDFPFTLNNLDTTVENFLDSKQQPN